MSTTPTLSVLTTMYNHEEFIAECIESVQSSKFLDYEHILVDDCSCDRTVAIANQYAAIDNRIKIYQNKENLGDYPNRNKAAAYAKGKYLKYVDGDDMISPWLLTLQVDSMEMNPNAALGLFVYGQKQSHKVVPLQIGEAISDYYANETDILNRSPLGAIIRNDKFNEVGGFPDKKYVGDFELWIKLNSVFPIIALPTLQAHYRVHPHQESAKLRDDYTIHFNYYRAAIDGLKYAKDLGINYENVEQAIQKKNSRTILSAVRKCRFKKALNLKSHTENTWAELFHYATK